MFAVVESVKKWSQTVSLGWPYAPVDAAFRQGEIGFIRTAFPTHRMTTRRARNAAYP